MARRIKNDGVYFCKALGRDFVVTETALNNVLYVRGLRSIPGQEREREELAEIVGGRNNTDRTDFIHAIIRSNPSTTMNERRTLWDELMKKSPALLRVICPKNEPQELSIG